MNLETDLLGHEARLQTAFRTHAMAPVWNCCYGTISNRVWAVLNASTMLIGTAVNNRVAFPIRLTTQRL